MPPFLPLLGDGRRCHWRCTSQCSVSVLSWRNCWPPWCYAPPRTVPKHPVYIYIHIIYELTYLFIYIYIHMLTRLKPTGFDFLLCLTVFFVCFCLQKQPTFFHSFEDFGCLSVMSYDASCVDTMAYFDCICSVFDHRIGLPTRSFNSNIDRMRTALWPNVNFKLYICFYTVFVPSCDTGILDFVHFQVLQTYYLMFNMVDMSLACFSLLRSFCLLLYYCSGSILWMCRS